MNFSGPNAFEGRSLNCGEPNGHRCVQGVVHGESDLADHFLLVRCHKEFCKICGEKNSPAHLRRAGRWKPRAYTWKDSFRYVVITFPEAVSERLQSKENLNKVYRYFLRKFKREGETHGLARWHFFGDCPHCRGQGCTECYNTGAGRKWHPHLNLLMPGGYINDKVLERWRGEFSTAVKRILGEFSPGVNTGINIHNHYYTFLGNKNPDYNCNGDLVKYFAKLTHKIKYCVRATFRIYNFTIDQALKGFRNSRFWGKWDESNPKMSPEEVSEINKMLVSHHELSTEEAHREEILIWYGKGVDPLTGDRIEWEKFIPMEKIDLRLFKKHILIEDVYYRRWKDGCNPDPPPD